MSPPTSVCAKCQAPASLKCSACESVFYCNKQHQKEHWSKHRDQCCPYEIRTTREHGRHLVAARNLKAEDLIVMEYPVVIGPRHFLPTYFCIGCCCSVIPSSSPACPQCKWPVCNEDCPGLPDHGQECLLLKRLAKAMTGFAYHAVLPLRCLLLQTQNPKMWKWLLEMAPSKERRTKEETENDDLIYAMESLLVPLSSAAPNLLPDCSLETVRKLYSVLDNCGLDWTTRDYGELCGLYPVACSMQQSCVSNTTLFFDETVEVCGEGNNKRVQTGRLTVKAYRDIKKGEILTKNWAHVFYFSVARLAEFRFYKNLRCSCVRCKDPYENGSNFGTQKCVDCSGYVVPLNTDLIEHSPWKCQGTCGKMITAHEAATIVGDFTLELNRTNAENNQTPMRMERLLTELEKHFHTNHQLCFTAKRLLLKLYGRRGGMESLSDIQLRRKAGLGRCVVDLMEQLGPCHIPEEIYMKADCELELVRAEGEILRRYHFLGMWNSDRVERAVSDCKARYRRILNIIPVQPSEFYEVPHEKIVTQVGYERFALFSWVRKNGLKVPDD